MSKSTDTKLIDADRGGENTQYESISTFIEPPAKDEGQFGGSRTSEADTRAQKERLARGEQTAENIRYGQSISEHGFGGKTTGNSGEAQQGGYGRVDGNPGEDQAKQTRREQGYGGGSGVGA